MWREKQLWRAPLSFPDLSLPPGAPALSQAPLTSSQQGSAQAPLTLGGGEDANVSQRPG